MNNFFIEIVDSLHLFADHNFGWEIVNYFDVGEESSLGEVEVSVAELA